MCELASAIHRQHVGELMVFGFFQLPCRVPRRLYQKHTDPLNCKTSSSDISGCHTNFHEQCSTVGEWQGNGMGMAWAWHGMCELVFNDFITFPQDRRFCSMKLLSATTGQKAQYTALKMH
jgi:hypothetical protein